MRAPRRWVMSAAFLAASGFLGGTGQAQAQTGVYGPGGTQPGTTGYSPGWRGYTPGYSWGPYQPDPWRGYVPGTVLVPPGTPATVYTPPQTTVSRPGVVAGGYVTAPSPTILVPRVATRTEPSYRDAGFRPTRYREFGSGRNVFLHKPWVPDQS